MLQFLAQLGRQRARRDSGLVRQNSSLGSADMAKKGAEQKAGHRFAAVVARMHDKQQAGANYAAALSEDAAVSVTDPRQKGSQCHCCSLCCKASR